MNDIAETGRLGTRRTSCLQHARRRRQIPCCASMKPSNCWTTADWPLTNSHFQVGPALALQCVRTRRAIPTRFGGRRATPCRPVVLSGDTRPGWKPRGAHTHGVDRGKPPRAVNTSLSAPPPSPSDPQKNLISDALIGPLGTLLSRRMGPVSVEGCRCFGHLHESRLGKGAT